ncbi:MAG TPA: hypothetical protein VI914_07115, partial [Thermodesulfobacteriota bacterium]|nr:hypothetical protein [Thermodesulfobacteriota bacterium]
IEPELEPAKIAEIVLPYTSDHQRLIKVIGEMGSLQNFYPQPEFTIPDENRRIDVIWKRETRGTPTYAFEVELSGGLDKALTKLHKCFRLWSTLPRVVTPTQDQSKIPNIASSYDLQFQKSIVCITPEQVQDIYAKKKSFKDLESKIGLL